MVESIDAVTRRIKNKRHNYVVKDQKSSNINISNLFSRILLSIIFFFASAIFINYSNANKKIFEKYIFTDSLSFQKFQNIYNRYFGNIIPKYDNKKTAAVFSDATTNIEKTKYYDGVMLKYPTNQAINTLKSGIVVFSGEKDNYGNVIIIQGIDGADIWYGNISNPNVNLYDYVEANSIIGETTDNTTYVVISKGGVYIDYDEYLKQIKS
ncbi:MAG: M23 family metallopeptidase [Bacilli bacterium]|nr:M23 family metallopeptidase [Bacilli bacterium]